MWKGKKYFRNALVSKRTTQCVIMGHPLHLWVAFGNRLWTALPVIRKVFCLELLLFIDCISSIKFVFWSPLIRIMHFITAIVNRKYCHFYKITCINSQHGFQELGCKLVPVTCKKLKKWGAAFPFPCWPLTFFQPAGSGTWATAPSTWSGGPTSSYTLTLFLWQTSLSGMLRDSFTVSLLHSPSMGCCLCY